MKSNLIPDEKLKFLTEYFTTHPISTPTPIPHSYLTEESNISNKEKLLRHYIRIFSQIRQFPPQKAAEILGVDVEFLESMLSKYEKVIKILKLLPLNFDTSILRHDFYPKKSEPFTRYLELLWSDPDVSPTQASRILQTKNNMKDWNHSYRHIIEAIKDAARMAKVADVFKQAETFNLYTKHFSKIRGLSPLQIAQLLTVPLEFLETTLAQNKNVVDILHLLPEDFDTENFKDLFPPDSEDQKSFSVYLKLLQTKPYLSQTQLFQKFGYHLEIWERRYPHVINAVKHTIDRAKVIMDSNEILESYVYRFSSLRKDSLNGAASKMQLPVGTLYSILGENQVVCDILNLLPLQFDTSGGPEKLYPQDPEQQKKYASYLDLLWKQPNISVIEASYLLQCPYVSDWNKKYAAVIQGINRLSLKANVNYRSSTEFFSNSQVNVNYRSPTEFFSNQIFDKFVRSYNELRSLPIEEISEIFRLSTHMMKTIFADNKTAMEILDLLPKHLLGQEFLYPTNKEEQKLYLTFLQQLQKHPHLPEIDLGNKLSLPNTLVVRWLRDHFVVIEAIRNEAQIHTQLQFLFTYGNNQRTMEDELPSLDNILSIPDHMMASLQELVEPQLDPRNPVQETNFNDERVQSHKRLRRT